MLSICIYTLRRNSPCLFPAVLKQNCPAPFFKLQRLGARAPGASSCVTHTRHSTEVTQDGPCVIGEDGEVPSMPAEERRGTSQTGRERQRLVPRTCLRDSSFTLKTVLIFPRGIRCRECWCPLCHSALPRGSPSLPLTSSTLAVRKKKGTVSTSTVPEPQSAVRPKVREHQRAVPEPGADPPPSRKATESPLQVDPTELKAGAPTGTCTPVFTVASFTTAETWMHPRPLIEGWISQGWNPPCNGILFSLQRGKILTRA